MRLIKSYTSKNTALEIAVEYDPKNNEVGEILSVTAQDYKKGVWVDITLAAGAMVNLDKIIDEINWRMLYAEQREDSHDFKFS